MVCVAESELISSLSDPAHRDELCVQNKLMREIAHIV